MMAWPLGGTGSGSYRGWTDRVAACPYMGVACPLDGGKDVARGAGEGGGHGRMGWTGTGRVAAGIVGACPHIVEMRMDDKAFQGPGCPYWHLHLDRGESLGPGPSVRIQWQYVHVLWGVRPLD